MTKEEITKDTPFSSIDPSKSCQDIQQLAQKTYDSGHELEAVIMLHGWMESFLNLIWEFWCKLDRDEFPDELKIKPKSYSSCIDILYEIGLIEENDRQQFLDFNSLRNDLAHEMFGVKRKGVEKHQVDTNFEKGLSCSGLIIPLILKMVHTQGRRKGETPDSVNKRISKWMDENPPDD